ncbi:hypothetical protein BD324DRAFT_622220 [Kockovaella imperatae]|uniref:Uncharacterized protein n=1 Tax=Kockovaella imperatae TaxID=4999 RepID=A0A1Y1UHJ3_9TREE|nr:hypothetical protein BD324DRAFT_622220 [Kockovaella imperatae]ORX37518.1 hypothetical protein BD324DRAFT_622220 [Kockovaella imperatae]
MSTEPGHSNSETHLTQSGEPDKRFKENGGGQHGNQGGRQTGFEEIGDGTSRLVTEGTGEDTGTYKPTEHGGEKKDGGQDKRTTAEHGFGGDHEAAVEAGKKGGSASYENGGLTA